MPDDLDAVLQHAAGIVERQPLEARLVLRELGATMPVAPGVDAVLARAAALLNDSGDCAVRAQRVLTDPTAERRWQALAAESLASALLYINHEQAEAVELLERWMREIGPIVGHALIARLAQAHLYRLDLPALERALALAGDHDLPVSSRLRSISCRMMVLAQVGRMDEALALAGQLHAEAAGSFTVAPAQAIEATYMSVLTRVLAGDLVTARDLAGGIEAVGLERTASLAALMRGIIAHEEGDLALALVEFDVARPALVQLTSGMLPIIARCTQANAEALAGRPGDALRTLDGVPRELRREVPVVAAQYVPAEALARAGQGDTVEALDLLLRHAARALSRGVHHEALRTLHLASRLGARWATGALLDRIQVDGPTPLTMRAHLYALRDGDVEALQRAAMRFADLGLRLRAAEVWADVATAHEQAGRRAEAEVAWVRARQGVQRCSAFGPTVTRILERS